MLDNLYGLKETHDIENFDQLFHDVGFKEILPGSSVVNADKAIYRLITEYLDDNHSKWHCFSYLAGENDYDVEGASHAKIRTVKERQENARAEFYPDGYPGYEEVGNTAYVTFDEFTPPDPDSYYAVEDPMDLPDSDTVALMMKAHSQITRENSPIENVVIDLSANGGGAADAAMFVMAWFLGEATVSIKDTMTGAMCSTTYRADANRDRKFDEKDTLGDRKLFCLTSNFSFSCGNLVPCVFKDSGVVTLLGKTSGGGCCPVQPISSAWGTSFQISSSKNLSFIKNGSFYDIDRGADPDYNISTPEKYYDRKALTEFINNIY